MNFILRNRTDWPLRGCLHDSKSAISFECGPREESLIASVEGNVTFSLHVNDESKAGSCMGAISEDGQVCSVDYFGCVNVYFDRICKRLVTVESAD